MSKSELSEMFVPLLQSSLAQSTKGVELTSHCQWFAAKKKPRYKTRMWWLIQLIAHH